MSKGKRFLLGSANLAAILALILVSVSLLRMLPPSALLGKPLMAAELVPLYFVGARWIERRKAVELRPADAPRGLGSGVLLGAALFSCVIGILWLVGVYQPSGWGSWRPLAGALVWAFAGAAIEEIIFRGFLFRVTAMLAGNWPALAVSSALFGLAHLANPAATWESSAAIAIEAGILLGAAFAATRSLWLPIGIHAGWNFAEGPVFGMASSGYMQRQSWIGGGLHGPTLVTGGAFGPEASIVSVPVCLVLAIVYLRKMAVQSPIA